MSPDPFAPDVQPGGRLSKKRHPCQFAFLTSAVLVVLSAFPAHAAGPQLARAFPINRALQRPTAQKLVNSSLSYVERNVTWPAVCDPAKSYLTFDYVVDSELYHDYLTLRIDGAYKWSTSGNQAGRKRINNIGCGTHTVRFEYFKDATISVGADDARVDNVAASGDDNGKAVNVLSDSFDDRKTGVPQGWSAGGTGQGWVVEEPRRRASVRRPAAQYHVPSSTSWMERTIVWPTASMAELSFDYFVDSEEGHDALEVYENGTLKWSMSGLGKSGRVTVPMVHGGPRLIGFVYRKNATVDQGRDLAIVDNIVASANGHTVSRFGFDGEFIGARPNRWTVGSVGLGFAPWIVAPPTPHFTYLISQSLPAAPIADGQVSPAEEYGTSPTSFAVPDYNYKNDRKVDLTMMAYPVDKSVSFFMSVPAANTFTGSEEGKVLLTLDAHRADTLNGTGCGVLGRYPRSEDRNITIDYTIPSGSSTATVRTTQSKGTCSPEWVSASSTEQWPISIGIVEVADDDGKHWVNIEVSLVLRPTSDSQSEPFDSGKIGVGLLHHRSSDPETASQRLPYADGSGPVKNDMTSLETLLIGTAAPSLPSTDNFDFCCYPGN